MIHIRQALLLSLFALSACRPGGESEANEEDNSFEELERNASLDSPFPRQFVQQQFTPQGGSLKQPTNKPLFHEPIVFPNNSEFSAEEEEQSEIPLWLLRELANERDLEKIFRQMVKNAKIVTVAGSKVLVHNDGAFVQGNANGASVEPLEIVALPRPQRTGLPRFSPFELPVPLPQPQNTVPSLRGVAPFSLMGPRLAFQNLSEVNGANNRVVGPSPVKLTQAAGCTPEAKTVEVPVPPGNARSIVLPKCVRVMQCAGCCGSSALVCEAIEEDEMEVSVNLLEYNRTSGGLVYKSTEKITLKSHSKCACNCKTKEHNCNASLHRYDPGECKCHCKNQEEKILCTRQQNKIWDNQTCSCNCRSVKECNSGFEQDPATCECASTRVAAKRSRKVQRRNSQG